MCVPDIMQVDKKPGLESPGFFVARRQSIVSAGTWKGGSYENQESGFNDQESDQTKIEIKKHTANYS